MATYKRQWRFYETAQGNSPVRKYLENLGDEDAAEIAAAMNHVRKDGLSAARHLQGEIYEVRISGLDVIYRVLFAKQGRFGQVLLALEAFIKKTQKTPRSKFILANQRLRDWKSRAPK